MHMGQRLVECVQQLRSTTLKLLGPLLCYASLLLWDWDRGIWEARRPDPRLVGWGIWGLGSGSGDWDPGIRGLGSGIPGRIWAIEQ